MKRNRLTSRLSALLVCLVLLAALLPTTAQASYSVYVNAKDGLGLNLRAGPGTEYATVRSSPVPMYTRLTISRTETSAAGNPWGYTSYDGVSGWVCLVETTTYDPIPVQTQSSPSQADFFIYVNAKDGLGLNIRGGPGTEYHTVRSQPIPMYTRLHITLTDTSSTGATWGYTSYDGVSGWVCLVETTTYDPTSVPEQELEPQPLGPTVPDVQDTQDTQETQQNQEPAAPATVQADSDSAVATPVMTMAIGILIGLLAAILVVLIVIAARKKK